MEVTLNSFRLKINLINFQIKNFTAFISTKMNCFCKQIKILENYGKFMMVNIHHEKSVWHRFFYFILS